MSTARLASPQHIYNPRSIKPTKRDGNSIVTPSLCNHHSSSLASLDGSSSTSDSGFLSVQTPNLLLPSPNSAFSPRGLQQASSSTLDTSVNMSPPPIRNLTLDSSYEENAAAQHEEKTAMPRSRRARLRDRKDAAAHEPPKSTATTLARKDSLLKNFIGQAEERDRAARREQRALSRHTRSRTRSASLNRNPVTTSAPRLYRSNSTASQHAASSLRMAGLQRSSSNVDVNKIVKSAESRDRHARVETARLEGLVPPRRYLGPKQTVKIRSRKSASDIIKDFESSFEGDSPRGETPPGGHEVTSSSERKHRKFSSFLSSSRLTPRTYQNRSGSFSGGNAGYSSDDYADSPRKSFNYDSSDSYRSPRRFTYDSTNSTPKKSSHASPDSYRSPRRNNYDSASYRKINDSAESYETTDNPFNSPSHNFSHLRRKTFSNNEGSD